MSKRHTTAALAVQPLEDRTTPASTSLQALDFDPSRVAFADVNGDGVQDSIGVTKAGQTTKVSVLYGNLNQTIETTNVFEASYTGGGRVSAGDLDGDGRAEIVVSADVGGSGRVVVLKVFADPTVNVTPQNKFSVFTQFQTVASFFGIEDKNFRGGSSVAVADLNTDGKADLFVAAGVSGGPRVAVYEGTTTVKNAPTHLVNDFFALPADQLAFRGGLSIDAGDLNADGTPDLVVGVGPGGGPRTRVLSGASILANKGATAAPLADFLLGGADNGNRLGVIVSFDRPVDGGSVNSFSVYPSFVEASTGQQLIAGGTFFLGKNLPKAVGQVPELDDRVIVQ